MAAISKRSNYSAPRVAAMTPTIDHQSMTLDELIARLQELRQIRPGYAETGVLSVSIDPTFNAIMVEHAGTVAANERFAKVCKLANEAEKDVLQKLFGFKQDIIARLKRISVAADDLYEVSPEITDDHPALNAIKEACDAIQYDTLETMEGYGEDFRVGLESRGE